MLWWTLRQLRSKRWETRKRAAGKLVAKRAVEPLVAMLKDPDYNARKAAAEALGQIGDARGVEPLVAALKDEHGWMREVRKAAAEALEKIRDARAIEPLVVALTDYYSIDVRKAAAKALKRINPNWAKSEAARRAVPTLVQRLASGDQDVHEAVAEALGMIDPNWANSESASAAVPTFVAALKNKDSGAARALGKIGDARAVRPLVTLASCYGSAHPWARVAIESLQQLLERSAASITSEDLYTVAGLPGEILYYYSNCWVGYKDCSHVKQLARQELIRRGLKA